jgi:hypothetical protein
VPTFKVPGLTRRRTLAAATAAATAAGVIGSFLIAAPASAQVVTCNSHTYSWAKMYATPLAYNTNVSIACIGFVSDNPITFANDTQVFCAGNNSGTITYYDNWTGTTATHSFWPGGIYSVLGGTYRQTPGAPVTADDIQVKDVKITGYSGSAVC